MNIKRFVISFISVTICFQLMDFLIVNVILKETFQSLQHIWRPDMNKYLWIMPVVSIIFAIIFTYIYIQWNKNKGILEGLRYGILMGILVNLVGIVNQFVIYPIPFSLALQLFLLGLIEFSIVGMLLSVVYKQKK